MSQGYTTVDKIVKSACMEEGDYGLHQYQMFLEWALECVQDFRIDSVHEVKTVIETVDSISTIPFPSDYVSWLKVGVKIGDRVKTLITNDRLSNHFDLDSSGNEEANERYTPNYTDSLNATSDYTGYWFRNVLFDGISNGNIFGYGNGSQGEGDFKVDRANRRFVFTSDLVGTDLLIEYVSTGLDESSDTLVEETLRKAVKYYILWRKAQRSKSYGMGEKELARRDWAEAKRIALRRNFSVDAEKLMAIVRASYMQTPKT